ncbi:helix-turn-helix transcriptional regulator [bacterium]|nr:helix-turn-helix transcriptional regulator [bacterium]
MTKMNVTDDPAQRVGAIMHNARMMCHMARNELAERLGISPAELSAYEHGRAPIPEHLLEYIFTIGYNTMRARIFQERYRQQRRAFRKIKQIGYRDGMN